jgi:FHS family L-fucose permease-like MFS transporter
MSKPTVRAAFVAVTTLFFAWGLITSFNDPVVSAVKGIYCLTDLKAQMVAFAFFAAYGVASFPGAVLLSRIRAVPAILIALTMMIGGCLLMLAAVNLSSYLLVLFGLFVLASGITILQVAANPLAAALGDPKGSHFRLTLSQTFNSVGTFVGPYVGAVLFLKDIETKGCATTEAAREASLLGLDKAYFWISAMLLALLVFFVLARKTVAAAAPPSSFEARRSVATMVADAFSSRWAVYGGIAIFLYVGAEVAIGTQMGLFLNSDAVWGQSDAAFGVPLLGRAMGADGVPGVSLQEAGKAVAFYWGGAMVGRAIGSALLARFSAARMLALFTATACAMCLYVVAVGGVSAGFVALAIGLFNSIMFPVIFTLTLERSSASTEATSGLLCTAIVGGAFVPLLVGALSDQAGYVSALVAPAVCYAVLCLFALAAGRAPIVARTEEIASIH